MAFLTVQRRTRRSRTAARRHSRARGQGHDERPFPVPPGCRRRLPGRHHRHHRRLPRVARTGISQPPAGTAQPD